VLQIAILALLLTAALGFTAVSLRVLARTDGISDMPARREFLSEFDGEGLPANMLVEAYEALGRRLGGRGERVTRSARLAADLRLSAADVEDVALLVAARCEGRLPVRDDLERLDASVVTVGDLIGFLIPFCTEKRGPRARLALLA
jgi:hypothetical protein